jgi:hypothetical protein
MIYHGVIPMRKNHPNRFRGLSILRFHIRLVVPLQNRQDRKRIAEIFSLHDSKNYHGKIKTTTTTNS